MDSSDQPHVFAAQIRKIWIMRVIDIPRDIGKAIAKLANQYLRPLRFKILERLHQMKRTTINQVVQQGKKS